MWLNRNFSVNDYKKGHSEIFWFKLLKLNILARRLYQLCTTLNIRSPAYGQLWPAYLMWRGPILARLLFLNGKAWGARFIFSYVPVQIWYREEFRN